MPNFSKFSHDNSFLTAPSSTGNTKTSTASSTYNQWVLENNGSNKYMIVNAATGYVLAPSGNTANSGSSVVATGKTGSTAQVKIRLMANVNFDLTIELLIMAIKEHI